MKIGPIHSDDDHARAVSRLEELLDAEPGTPEASEAEVLTILVDSYESKHHAIEPPDPIESLKFMLDQEQITKRQLADYLGGASRVSEVLNGTRDLNLAMIRRLHNELGMSAETLLQIPKVRRARIRTAAKRVKMPAIRITSGTKMKKATPAQRKRMKARSHP